MRHCKFENHVYEYGYLSPKNYQHDYNLLYKSYHYYFPYTGERY